MRRRRLVVAGSLAVLAVFGSELAAAQTDEQTITIQVEANRSLTLDTAAVTGDALRPTDEKTYGGGTITYSTDNPVSDEIVASFAAGLANPSTDIALAVKATSFSCTCSTPGTAVDPDPSTGVIVEPVPLSDIGPTAVITGISDTSGYDASATLTYTVTSTLAAPGEYTFTVTYLLRGI